MNRNCYYSNMYTQITIIASNNVRRHSIPTNPKRTLQQARGRPGANPDFLHKLHLRILLTAPCLKAFLQCPPVAITGHDTHDPVFVKLIHCKSAGERNAFLSMLNKDAASDELIAADYINTGMLME